VAVPIVFFDSNLAIAQTETGESTYYTTQPGDTPLGIAVEHNIPVEILLNVNNITDPRAMQVGQELNYPPPRWHHPGLPVLFCMSLKKAILWWGLPPALAPASKAFWM
jgi:LysM repeat protein